MPENNIKVKFPMEIGYNWLQLEKVTHHYLSTLHDYVTLSQHVRPPRNTDYWWGEGVIRNTRAI